MLKSRLSTVFLIFVMAAYVLGMFTVKYQIFPYDHLSIVKRYVVKSYKESQNIKPQKFEVYDEKKLIDATIRKILSTVENAVYKREELKRKTIITDYKLNYMDIDERARYLDSYLDERTNNLRSNIEVVRVTHYGVIHHGILIQTSQMPNKNLLIYNQGHGGNPFRFEYFITIIEEAKIAGYDVLALSMSGLGLNDNNPIIFPTRNGMVKFINNGEHKIFSQFYDSTNPELTGLAPMLSGNYHLIKDSIKRKAYEQVVMTGISGGGWYTTILSALIPDIERSISFAGTVPLGLIVIRRDMGDYEQYMDRIYQSFDYWEFYVLATMDDIGQANRNHHQIYNLYDPCCFDGRTASAVIDILEKSGGIPNMNVEIIRKAEHAPDLGSIKKYLLF